jgi:hypothetical protein
MVPSASGPVADSSERGAAMIRSGRTLAGVLALFADLAPLQAASPRAVASNAADATAANTTGFLDRPETAVAPLLSLPG